MRPQKVIEEQLIDRLMSVLQAKGYEGSTLNDLAKATGLQKASLYHRFPDGKREIALAVLSFVNSWVEKNIYGILTNSSLTKEKRLQSVIKNIQNLYDNGQKGCLLGVLTIESSVSLFNTEINKTMQLWKDGFTAIGMEYGFTKKKAAEKALTTLFFVQGSLIVSRGTESANPFQFALKSIENMYLET